MEYEEYLDVELGMTFVIEFDINGCDDIESVVTDLIEKEFTITPMAVVIDASTICSGDVIIPCGRYGNEMWVTLEVDVIVRYTDEYRTDEVTEDFFIALKKYDLMYASELERMVQESKIRDYVFGVTE